MDATQTQQDVTIGNVHGGLFPVLLAAMRQGTGPTGPQVVVCPDPDGLQDDSALGLPTLRFSQSLKTTMMTTV